MNISTGDKTLHAADKRVNLLLTACMFILLNFTGALARAEEPSAFGGLQPQSLNHAGIYALRRAEPNLTGSGVKFAVICRSITYLYGLPQNDYRPNIEHRCFKPEQFSFYDQGQTSPGISPHSTAICSILFGQDPNATSPQLGQFSYQGAVPQAHADMYEFWHFLFNNVTYNLPPAADILVAEFGWQFEDWWTRGIESLAQHHGLIVVAGIGNGSDACDPPLYPGAAANVIGVGVVDSVRSENLTTDLANFSLVYPEHSSFGPTSDGRCKPDIVAPGKCLAANAFDPDGYEPTGNCSSFATPIVAGTIGLLIQKAKEDAVLNLAVSPQGGNCVIKAILMNSATKLPYWHKGSLTTDDDNVVPLDYSQGAGMVNALAAYEQLVAGRQQPGVVKMTGWDNNLLDKSEIPAKVYRINAAEPAGKSITATLVWNKHYQSVCPFEHDAARDSNLRLELWAIDPNKPGSDFLLDFSDSPVDNVEHIHCQTLSNYTSYEIVVFYSDISKQSQEDAKQRYGLAWSVTENKGSDSIFWHDLNADGIVNELDLIVLLENYKAASNWPGSYQLGDINVDGTIDVQDLQILLDNQNQKADWRTK